MKKIIFDKENENRPYVAANAVIFKNIKGKQYLLLGKKMWPVIIIFIFLVVILKKEKK